MRRGQIQKKISQYLTSTKSSSHDSEEVSSNNQESHDNQTVQSILMILYYVDSM